MVVVRNFISFFTKKGLR